MRRDLSGEWVSVIPTEFELKNQDRKDQKNRIENSSSDITSPYPMESKVVKIVITGYDKVNIEKGILTIEGSNLSAEMTTESVVSWGNGW